MEQLAMQESRDLINGNWRPVAFSARTVEPEELICLLEGAKQTPSYMDEQPWNFIIATKDNSIEYERLVSCLAEVNVEGARRAPVLMLSVVRLNSSFNGERNVHAFRDARHAVSNIVLRAKAMGLAAQQITGFDAAKAREQFQIPPGFAPTTGIALGYPIVNGSTVLQHDRAGRGDRPVESFVFTGSWGRASTLINQPGLGESRRDCGCKDAASRSSSAA